MKSFKQYLLESINKDDKNKVHEPKDWPKSVHDFNDKVEVRYRSLHQPTKPTYYKKRSDVPVGVQELDPKNFGEDKIYEVYIITDKFGGKWYFTKEHPNVSKDFNYISSPYPYWYKRSQKEFKRSPVNIMPWNNFDHKTKAYVNDFLADEIFPKIIERHKFEQETNPMYHKGNLHGVF